MDAGGATIRLIQVDEVEVFRRIRLEALRAEPSSLRAATKIGRSCPTRSGPIV